MSASHVKYLLIGAGLAASSAADAIRKRDAQGELTLIGQERIGPYIRPPLSKVYLRQRTERADLFTHPAGWYSDHRIQLRTGVRAEHLDAARRIVTLESGEELSFDVLLLATGMSPRHLAIPGGNLANVYYLRTADDADRLHNAVEKTLRDHAGANRGTAPDASHGRASVIGGGVLGVELAATLTQLGLAVDLFVSNTHPWHKFAGDHTGRFLVKFLENHGIAVHTNAIIRTLDGDGRVQRVVLDDGSKFPCDFVAAAVGAVANRELLRGTPIRCEKAILVDPRCRTNVEGIFAAGDCAAIFDPLFGKHRILDHYDSAIATGTIAGSNMAGGEASYDIVSSFFSDVFDLSLNGCGEGRAVDRRLIRSSTATDSPDFLEFGIAPDGRIAQVLSINHAGEDDLLKQLISRRVRVEGNEESLKDPAFPLATLLKTES